MHHQPSCQTEKSTESKLKSIGQTLRNIVEVKNLLLTQIEEVFPPGTEISWRILDRDFTGHVQRVEGRGIQVERNGAIASVGIQHVLAYHGIK